MDYLREIQGKQVHDPIFLDAKMNVPKPSSTRCVFVPGPIIVGAGPSGLAVAACLKQRGVPSVILERSSCIASLWQLKTYDRLRLHLPKHFCELPLMAFPGEFPTYPTKQQFVLYLEAYASRFNIKPRFNESVVNAEYDQVLGLWRVRCRVGAGAGEEETDYVCRWLVVATGENAEAVVPEIEGAAEFGGDVKHTSMYKSGEEYRGKRVLVVGCGNSGMEVCLDLFNHGAHPSIVVRDSVHVLPREMLGQSTFGLSMWLTKWLPIQLVDRFLLLVSRLKLGNTARLGLDRPRLGPLQLKNLSGKTPVLDVGTLAKIKTGDIKVCPAIHRLKRRMVEFVNNKTEHFDAIILATGYKSNVPSWLQEGEMFSEKDGFPRSPFPMGWKGESGLYAVGFTKRGILGASMDANRIAEDIGLCWEDESKHTMAFARPLVATFSTPCFPTAPKTLRGHLVIDKRKHQMQREMKDAVSTSHCSQPNTIEYDMAIEWHLLAERSDREWISLHELQVNELRNLKATLKSK